MLFSSIRKLAMGIFLLSYRIVAFEQLVPKMLLFKGY